MFIHFIVSILRLLLLSVSLLQNVDLTQILIFVHSHVPHFKVPSLFGQVCGKDLEVRNHQTQSIMISSQDLFHLGNGPRSGPTTQADYCFYYCIVLYLQPVLNPKSYDGARVLEASGRPMLVIGRSYVVSIQVEGDEEGTTKLTEEMTE